MIFLLFVYRIRAYRPLAVYKNLRVFWWWFIEIFWVFAPKSSKKWALGAKKWWFIQIWLQWWLGPVTPLQILPTNGPDDLYTIQNINLKFAAKLAFSISPTSSAQPALPENPGRAGWAELVGEIEQAHLAVTLDFYSVWYRDHLIH